MDVRRNLTDISRKDPSIVAPLARLAIDLDRQGRVDTDVVGSIRNTPVTLGMLKAIYELYSGVPFGQWPVTASSVVIDHWRNEWRMPAASSARADGFAAVAGGSPRLTDVARSSPAVRASNDTIVQRSECLTVVQRMCADSFGPHATRRPPTWAGRQGIR
jgi:hypothetical protein